MSLAYDIFISYARVDNEESITGDVQSCWVSMLRNDLQKRVDQMLGRRGETKIWMDLGELPGNGSVTPDIEKALRDSATLVVLFSRGYLDSEWCRKEYEMFVKAAGSLEKVRGRIFLIQLDELEDVPRTQWPEVFSDLVGYPFYEKDDITGLSRRLADPKPDPQQKAYWDLLNKLRTELAEAIKRVRKANDEPGPAANGNGRVLEQPAERKRILLGETASDRELYADRESIAAFLKGEGCEVLPSRYYPRAEAEFAKAMDRDLATAELFVQLLGPLGTPRTEDLPEGYEGLQLARARAAGKPIVRWRSKAIDLKRIYDSQYREFIEGPDVMAMDLEELKSVILGEVRRLRTREELTVPETDRFILVSADKDDLSLADRIGEALEQRHLGYDILAKDNPLDDFIEAEPCDGVIVAYGQCDQDWVQERVRALRRLSLAKKGQAPSCGVFISAPFEKPLRCRFSNLHVIEESDDAKLNRFLEEISRRKVAP